ncbi:YbfB/YjiJ family MFS transporter [Sphaerotilus uruguayifluvii]|uniref:MFS-type transporter involved in bile tolerance (Atg22 family) n=1 Tax=Sphaerotilus uruguayifluvii TaxID=2735897 RepID=A0ABX2G2J0_9BURK|nr:YbfB/YjiJ family MFS transporter [Leptothrix sp. C29]NRT56521.1 MFS-type transporter involved in bile tolerance (Atg22 family) [Leptothrix sp. C29]
MSTAPTDRMSPAADAARLRVLVAGLCSLMLTMGVARFAYTPLMPLMQREAGLGVAEAGGLAAVNYAGYLSGAVLFGATFIGLVSLVLTMAGRFHPNRPARMMGRMTLTYGVAQIIGPAVTGWLAARSGGSYTGGLLGAAVVMAVGLALLVVLRQRGRQPRLPPSR